jgi:hypothetical protein
MAVARKIRAKHYLECSAKTGEGVREVFEYATRATLLTRRQAVQGTSYGPSEPSTRTPSSAYDSPSPSPATLLTGREAFRGTPYGPSEPSIRIPSATHDSSSPPAKLLTRPALRDGPSEPFTRIPSATHDSPSPSPSTVDASPSQQQREEAKHREEEAWLREEEVKKKEEDVRRKAEAARHREEKAKRTEKEARRQADEVRRQQEEVRRREKEVKAKEDEAVRKEAEILRRERKLREREDDIRRKEEAVRREKTAQAAKMAEDMRREKQELGERSEEIRQKEEAVQREASAEIKRKERGEEEPQRKQNGEDMRRWAREAIEPKKKEEAAVVKREDTDDNCGYDIEHDGSQLKKSQMLLQTLTDLEADLPQSSRSQGLTTTGQPGTGTIKDSIVLKNVSTKSPASSEFRYTYVRSISSTQTVTIPSSNRHLRAYYLHKGQWDCLHTEKYLKWDMFPWPVLKQPTKVEEIIADDVEEYLDSLYQLPQNTFGSMEEYVVDYINRWDYDRMDAKVFSRVHIGQRRKVEEGVIRVGAILLAILRNIQEAR